MTDEAREAALAAWLGPRVTHGPRDHAFRAGYDAARAEHESALATERERNAKLNAELENVKAGRDAHKAASDERYDELQKVRAELDQLRKDYAAVKAAWEGRG